MTLTINAPAVESRLQQEAAQQGISAEEYALRLLEAHLALQEGSEQVTAQTELQTEQELHLEQEAIPVQQKTSSEEWLLRFRTWVESHQDFPTLSPQAFERASFYEGRP